MSLDSVGASNFYYYGKPSSEIPNPFFPPDQKITTQLPSEIVAIRIGAIFIVTAYAAYALAKETGLTVLRWPVIILGITLSAYIAYKHLFIKDPLVEAFYKIAGGKENYDNLPQIPLDISKKTCDNFKMSWDTLEHPLYRFTTADGRKGLLVKGLSHAAKQGFLQEKLGIDPSQTQDIIIFVEKLGPYDVPRKISNLAEWGNSILTALVYNVWENPFSTRLYFSLGSSSNASGIFATMSTDNANEFIAQRGVVNQLEPRVVDVTDDSLLIERL